MYKNKISNLIVSISSGLFECEHILSNVLLAVIRSNLAPKALKQ
ncbi:hypothetical protein [uncultured Campylobacter sp.]|nr:hypothetical protein [uncultured Campylobacter sp.]